MAVILFKKFKTIFIAIFICVVLNAILFAYDRSEVMQYVKNWTNPPPPAGIGKGFQNPQYNFYGKSDNDGSDCANFVSQALIAGCYSQAFINRPDSGMNRWTISNAKALGTFLETISTHETITMDDPPPNYLEPGDVIIWGDLSNNSNRKHAIMVTAVEKNLSGIITAIKFAAHTNLKFNAYTFVNGNWAKEIKRDSRYKNAVNVYHINPSPYEKGPTHDGPTDKTGIKIQSKDDWARAKPAKTPVIKTLTARDPNYMYGPEGQVQPGQIMRYTVEFENEGEGIAYGVYVTDILDKNLDDSTLAVKDFYSVDWNTKVETPATYPYNYDPQARTLTVLVDEVGSRKGGKFMLEARLKNDALPGTVIPNHATVYFASVPEVTPTNSVISVVPMPSRVTYSGATAVRFSDYVVFRSSLAAGDGLLSGKEIEFVVGGSTYSAITNSDGMASVYPDIIMAPGTYELKAEFAGDGYYYLPSAYTGSLEVQKENTVLSGPGASVLYPSTAVIPITLMDDEGDLLLNQGSEPKTLYLECRDSDTWKPLSEALLSGTTAVFEFQLPKPLKLSYNLRARFDGDVSYDAASSTGTLTVIDKTPPEISINSPKGGERYAGTVPMRVEYAVMDDLDPSPVSYAYIRNLADGATVQVVNGAELVPMNIQAGSWTLTVEASDWSGNKSSFTTGAFEIIHDALAPNSVLAMEGDRGILKAAEGINYVSGITTITITSIDDLAVEGDGAGLGVKRQRIGVRGEGIGARDEGGGTRNLVFENGNPAAGQAFVSTFSLSGEGDGLYQLEYNAEDIVGNIEAVKIATVAVDNTAPVTKYEVSGMKYEMGGNTYINGNSGITLMAVDPVINGVSSGVKDSFVSMDGVNFSVVSGSFTLNGPDGLKTIYYYSSDIVLNTETVKTASFVLDATPPAALLVSPSPVAIGMDRIFKGDIPVTVSLSDANFKDYRLEYAPGQDAQSGFITLAEGTAPVSAVTVWNTSDLSGYQTLKLTASDIAGNVTVSTAAVFIGEPSLNMTISGLKKPEGVAIDETGNIYAANTEKDEILKFSSDGNLIARFMGDGPSTSLRIKPGDRGAGPTTLSYAKATESFEGQGFRKPTGIAVSADSIYVADKGNNRIAVLNSTGTVIKSLGKTNPEGKFIPGKGPGEFNHPTGIAVKAGRVAVADRSRVQVFDASFTFLFEIKPDAITANSNIEYRNSKQISNSKSETQNNFQSPVTSEEGRTSSQVTGHHDTSEEGEEDREETDDDELKPVGVAIDDNGNIYVADRENGKILAYDGNGGLLGTFGSKGGEAGQFESPGGIAVSPLKYIYVADKGNKRVQKTDVKGTPLLAFGKTFELEQPVGAALDSAENIYITDRKEGKLLKFGLGTSNINVSLKAEKEVETAGTFKLRRVYAYPNQAIDYKHPVIRVETGIADRVEIRIYNSAGELVEETAITARPALLNDTYAYEYKFASDKTPYGICTYKLKAYKSGYQPIRAEGKLMFVKWGSKR